MLDYKLKQTLEAKAAFALNLPLCYYCETEDEWIPIKHTDAVMWQLFDVAADYEHISEGDTTKVKLLAGLMYEMTTTDTQHLPFLLPREEANRLYALSGQAVGGRTLPLGVIFEDQFEAVSTEVEYEEANNLMSKVYAEIYKDGSFCLKFSDKELGNVGISVPKGYSLVNAETIPSLRLDSTT